MTEDGASNSRNGSVKDEVIRHCEPEGRGNPGVAESLAARPPVFIWVDSFTDAFESMGSGIGPLSALVRVLASAGYRPEVIGEEACCGLTWITTGQHDGARAQLRKAAEVLAHYAAKGPIIGMEPSCLAVWRSDAEELLPDNPQVKSVARAVKTLAEFLETIPDYTPPDLSGHTIVAQPHCHHASVLGWQADQKLLERTGARVVTVKGCCGLAGNFGVERGHYDVSLKVYAHDLKPAIAAADPDAILLADGFSCRKQISDLDNRQALTLAQLFAFH